MTTAQKEPRRQLAAFRLRALCRSRRAPILDAQPTSFSQAASRCARPSIVALDPQPFGGRRRNRIRHPDRKCRSRLLQKASSLNFATLNVQGWNWSRLDPWNTDKAAELVSLARQHYWDVLALSDLHTCAGEMENWENTSRTARRVQRDVSQAIVAMEEFILVTGQRSGFLLSPAVAEAWRDNGCAKELSDDGRLLRLNINILYQRYDFVSGYAPTGDTRGRRDFFESASAFLSTARPNALQLWLGDWNGHVGRLSAAPSTVQGRFRLSTPTTAAGRELLQWLEESTPSLQVADSYSRIGHRGTWRLVRDIPGRAPDWHWYELDLFLCSAMISARCHRWRTIACFSDHFAKSCRLSLGRGRQTGLELHRLRAKASRDRRKPLRPNAMRGPSAEALTMRDQYREETERLAAESGPTLSWDDVACICTSELERIAGRGSRRQGLPFLDGHVKEVEQNRTQLRNQYDACRRALGTAAEPRLRAEYKEPRPRLEDSGDNGARRGFSVWSKNWSMPWKWETWGDFTLV